MISKNNIIQLNGISYLPEAQAIIAESPSKDMFTDPLTHITWNGNLIAPCGDQNNLYDKVRRKMRKSDVVSSNNHFNILACYGQGLFPMKKVVSGKETHLEDCTDEKVLSFWEDNDIPRYFLEQCTDLITFGDPYPEVVLTKDLKQIYSLRHKEAMYSRWGIADKATGEIINHYYSSSWERGVNSENVIKSDVLNKYNPYADLTRRIANRKYVTPRFILQLAFPSAGNFYYHYPSWWSIFHSGWFDYSCMIPEFKKALLKNGLVVKYIIYLSDKYWSEIFREEKIDEKDPEAVMTRKNKEYEKFKDYLNDQKNSGKGLVALKKMIASGNSAIEEKYITIEEVKNSMKGGELLEDSSEASNMMSYAQQVHSSIVATPPGKNGGSMSGTDKRELYNIKTAMMTPYRDLLIQPFNLIKRFNNWPKDTVFVVKDYQFVTTDVSKNGKQSNTEGNVNK